MRERPILFSAPMVRAILAGTKSQTRRAVKLPHANPLGEWEPTTFGGTDARGVEHDEQAAIWHTRTGETFGCPYGVPGDSLWVREACAIEHELDGSKPPFDDGRPTWRRPNDVDPDLWIPAWRQAHYRATDPPPDLCCEQPECAQCRDHDYGPHWRPSIHMPRWASRITLEVTDVRVERLQAISEADAIAEGIGYDADGYCWSDESAPARGQPLTINPVDAYRWLWESINGAGSWDANPWVWVVSFRRIEA